MKLREFFDSHIGEVVRVGCTEGTGFIYAGLILPETEETIARKLFRPDVSNLPIIEMFESFYGGTVLIIPGTAYGHEWIPKELERPTPNDCPIEQYQRFADWIAGETAREYIAAYLTSKKASKRTTRETAETEMMMCERFFKSDTFALLMPHVDADDLIMMMQRKALEKIQGDNHGR